MIISKNGASTLGALVASAFIGACSSSGNGNAPHDAGPGGTVSDGAASGTTDGSAADSGMVACSDAGTLYSRLGGHAGIRAAVNAIVAKELADPDIVTYFFNQVATPIPAGHPSAGEIEECFTDLLASAAGGPEVYPPAGGAFDDGGNGGAPGTFTCRDMTTIHQGLLISGGTFDKFVMIAGSVLQPSVSSCDLSTIASVLESVRSGVVTPSLADAGAEPYPGSGDAGPSDAGPSDAGAGPTGDGGADGAAADSGTVACSDAGTLYSRLGGHAGIRSAINAVVAKELADPDIVTYFFNQVATPIPAGHPSAGEIEECFTDLLASAAGGSEVYPPAGGAFDDGGNGGAPGTFMCRDMTTIHQPLLISGGTFDKFVMIAGGVLQPSVSSCDLSTIASVLESVRSGVVAPSLSDAGAEPYPGDAGSAGDGQ